MTHLPKGGCATNEASSLGLPGVPAAHSSFAPSGQRIGKIALPVQTVTKAAFGGADLLDLYCTTAWLGNADKRGEQPTLGGLYRVRVETPGLPQNRISL